MRIKVTITILVVSAIFFAIQLVKLLKPTEESASHGDFDSTITKSASIDSKKIFKNAKDFPENEVSPKPSISSGAPDGAPGIIPRTKNETNKSDTRFGSIHENDMDPNHLSSALENEIQNHTWIGGGFQPPNIPNFDELFRSQRKKTAFNYSGLSLLDGLYAGEFGTDAKSKQGFFEVSLKQVKANERTGFQASAWQWTNQPRIDLSAFQSSYSRNEIYYGFLHLPTSIVQSLGIELGQCTELLVIRHFDNNWDENKGHVEFFNNRVYCRRGLDDLNFIGRLGLKWLSAAEFR